MESKAQTSKHTVDQSDINAEEKIISLFEPDTLLSASYFENLRRETLFEPERRLMLG